MKTDIFGNEIYIGDDVVIIEPYYHSFANAKVIKFTPKGFRVRYISEGYRKEKETVVFGVVKGKMKEDDKGSLEEVPIYREFPYND